MVSFAKGFAEGASSGPGNWPLRYAIFPISASRNTEQAVAGKFKMLLPAGARIGAWEGVKRARTGGARGGGDKRGAEEAGTADCAGLCRRFFREDCDPEPTHIVMIVGSDAAAAEYSAEFLGDTPAALGAAREAAKTEKAAAVGRNPPRRNTCLSVYPFGAYRPPEIGGKDALGNAQHAIATGAPVAISATLARAARAAAGPGPRYSSDPYEGGARPIPNLDNSLRLLSKTNGGTPVFSTNVNRRTISFRIRLHPPPFELRTGNDHLIAQLFRDTRKETNTLLALRGKTSPHTNIWGNKIPNMIYEVRIPASSVLSPIDIDTGINYKGQVTINTSSEETKPLLYWLYR